uniref:Uncharacterized protein LOC104211709 n=1 Tax=Nicotiana sylvestris TaxID=4096 RepID=A0A1U7VA02_NICSY|nr:PREDICTED: uncharacterized protein LOC104211709 [Nicotiana sylvestris]
MRLVDDDQVVQDEIQNNVVQANDEDQIDSDDSFEKTQEEVNPSREHIDDIPEPVVQKAWASFPKPSPPYPQRLYKKNGGNQFKKFIQMMNILSINVPLVESLKQMPRVMQRYGTFTISCTIGSAEFAKALCDLGARINFMPYSIFKILGIGKPRPTYRRLQMVDRTMKRSLCVTEDVLVQVDKFILPADLVTVDCQVDFEVSIILGRHLLAKGKALCDVEAQELTFRVCDEQVVFHVCKSMRQPNNNEVCSFVDLVTDVIVDDTSATINVGEMLEAVLLNFDDDEVDGFIKCMNSLQGMRVVQLSSPETTIGS